MTTRLVFLLTRLDHLDREEFQRTWWDDHAPLVAERAATLGIVGYQQVHTIADDDPRGSALGPAPFDGIAELWIDPEAATGSIDERRQAGEELLEDERRFIDLPRSPIWMADEVVQLAGRRSGLRLSSTLYRRADLDGAEFRRHWREVHGPLALAPPDPLGIVHYVQLHTPDDAETFPAARRRSAPPPPDGLVEAWFDELPDWGASSEGRRRSRDHEQLFLDRSRLRSWLSVVRPVVGSQSDES